MALNFPLNPSDGEPYVDPTSGLKYIFNRSIGGWETAIQPPVIITIDGNAPDITIDGFLWWDGQTRTLYILRGGSWTPVTSSGGGGGGGAGIPAGAGGGVNANAGVNGGPGNAGTISEGGAGGPRANNDGEAISGEGGDGGEATQAAGSGVTGTGGEGSTYGGGPGGSDGAAIRKSQSGFTVNVNIASSGTVSGVQNATTVL